MVEPSLLQTVREYIQVILPYWWALFPGVVMVLPEIYKWVHPQRKELEIPHWIRVTSVIVAISLVQFLAYRNSQKNLATVIEEKRQLSVKVNEQSQKIGRPDLHPKISQVFSAPAGDREKDVLVGVMGTITNLGYPGAVADFWVDLKLSESRILHGKFPIPPGPKENIIIGKDIKGNKMFLRGEVYWARTATSQPIPTNVGLDGWIMAVFRGATAKETRNGKTTVILRCSDATGKESSSAEYTLSSEKESNLFGIEEIQKHKRKY
jgi:hypothetical protein